MSKAVSPKFVSRVAYIDDMKRGRTLPVDVSFHDHAAVFFVEREHPCFQRWFTLLKKSARDDSTVVFSYAWRGRHIRSVEPGDKITGVVGEIHHGMQENATGFTIAQYAGIFLIPANHPQLLDWLVLIHKSRNGNIKIVCAYDAYHNRVTSLALAEE